eukprot:jgi/Undpi1/5966/HiC_scaffold_2.g01240.m1
MVLARSRSRPLACAPLLALLVASALLVDGNNAETPTETTTPGPPEEVLDENRVKVFNAREYAEFGTHKRLIYPDKSLDDWHEFGFADGGARADEFEALRVDEVLWNLPDLASQPTSKQSQSSRIGVRAGSSPSSSRAEGVNGVRRIHEEDVSPENFKHTYEPLHEPLVIDGIPEADQWQAAHWTIPLLAKNYPEMNVRVGAASADKSDVKMTMADFDRYTRTQQDDTPLYVFDHTVYDDKIGEEVMGQYRVPDMFSEDLFQLVQGDPGYPAYRWLLLGPKRSGSACHNDPLGTSAWNTLISGRKLWFFAPPYLEEVVLPTKDKTVVKWFLEDLPKLRSKYEDEMIVYVQHPGETMFVPAFWLHAVLNLDDTVAVTQNFVSEHTFPESWDLTRKYLPRFAKKWLQQLVIRHEDLALKALKMNAARRTQEARRLAAKKDKAGREIFDDYEGDEQQ